MAFDARAAAAESADEDYPPFEFIGLDGNTYELPNPLTLTEREVARIREGDNGPLEERSPEGFEAMQDLPLHISLQLGQAWFDSAEEAGKSPSPSRATRRAVKPSKRTSPAKA
jgi:hypothetical protein